MSGIEGDRKILWFNINRRMGRSLILSDTKGREEEVGEQKELSNKSLGKTS